MTKENEVAEVWYDGEKLFPMVKPDGGRDLISEEVVIKRNDGILLGHYNFSEQYWFVREKDGSASIYRDGQYWQYRWEKPI